ncbi:MAG: VOC family protein [Prevotellaceae bacterium]|jgi:glyoxylase I family protein|nr:VOC family protein [Prevotellaceae bacterium]
MKNVFAGIDHPAIAADDAVKLANWYCEVLGYEVFLKTDKPIYLIKAPDKTFIEIMPKDNNPRQNRTVCTPGWSHLALRVNDMDKAIEILDRAGVKWEGDEFEAVGGGRIRNFLDVEGNLVQIVQRTDNLQTF